MVTNPSDYEEMLWQLQSNAPTNQAILLPKDEKIYDINLNTRVIDVPKFLSVEKDHQAETIYFKFDRYFDHTDLTTKSCIIQYTNALGKTYIYPVPFYDVISFGYEGKVLIPWCIQGPATEKSGIVKFAVCFYSIDIQHKLSYCLNTLVAKGEILQGQNDKGIDDLSPDQIILDSTLLELIQELERMQNEGSLSLYWLDV